METPDEEVKRLDTAARARLGEKFFAQNRWVAALNLSLPIWAFFFFQAPHWEELLMRTLAVLAATATVPLWLNWRYSLYLSGPLVLACGLIAMMLLEGPPRNARGLVGLVVFLSFLAVVIFKGPAWTCAGPYARAHLAGWEKERTQVDGWWRTLKPPELASGVIEFSTGSLLAESTFRLLKVGPYWAVEEFKGFFGLRPVDFRVRELDDVKLATVASGEIKVTLGDRTVKAVNISPPGFGLAGEASLPMKT